ncbi:MAG: 4-hydroxythreonine-4-phosphate dehydrogenase PdxA [Flavobacteriales bacterium]|nr:4-hydroxythreonine-4-phosphate dehydrogenase PdxA [Flavobacteriales bacterium]
MNANVKVGISIGDLNGVGPEIILKTFSDLRMLSNITPVIYGADQVFKEHMKRLELEVPELSKIQRAEDAKEKKVNLITVWKEEVPLKIGESNKQGGTYAFKSLEAATKDLIAGKIDVLVTAPINKENIQSETFNFPGHTEYLADMANVDNALMFMCSDQLRVGVVTGHIPLKDVSSTINEANIYHKIDQINNSLIRDFGINKPKIAVLGLNPHAGEGGLIGKEDDAIIAPAIQKAFDEGIMAFGPYPADGFFGSANFKNYDAVLAMYHDQGLIPFKAMTFGSGVNYTAGLPIIRTSPDHGTAFDIAGKDKASVSSFRNAIFMARDIFLKRAFYQEINANPLKVSVDRLSKEGKRSQPSKRQTDERQQPKKTKPNEGQSKS